MVKCMNSPYGMVFFCIPNGTSCPKGIGWQFEGIDGNGMVVIKKSICPEGYYQVEPSKCHNACRTKHELLEMIPEGFKVVLKGNHIRQTLLMCDYKAGYFNADNKSFVNYDDNFLGHLDFCTHINHSNPCSSGQMPLYNGTCVEPCRPGYERDETDFLCKQVGYIVTSDKDTQLGQPTTSRPTVKPEPKTTTTDNGHEDDKDKGRGINGKSENSNVLPWYMYFIIVLVIVAGITIIALVTALVIKICCPQRCQGKHKGPSCTYQAVFRECTDQSGSDLSTASYTEGGRSTTDESTVDVNETPDAAQGTTKMEISPSSESIK
ncbi:uncharacterized protein LOC128554926, partial [Mercenaria mercenaria]|uniref:uncharacterized protein LOC128554926 n=1 Tax=Mercenaria mercenaria TaxID=6596 RepID=UPI00234EF7F3